MKNPYRKFILNTFLYTTLYSIFTVSTAIVYNNVHSGNLLQYSSIDDVALYDRCAQRLPNYVYNISTSGHVECINIRCEKSTQREYNGECLTCSISGCTCPPGSILRPVSRSTETVLECQANQRSQKNLLVYQTPCAISNFVVSNGTCQCPTSETSGYLEENGICFPSKDSISEDSRTLYSTIDLGTDKRFLSNLIYGSLRGAIFECFHFRPSNKTACSYLLNLCTLKLITSTSVQTRRIDYSNLCHYLFRLNDSFAFEYPPFHLESHIPVEFKSLHELEFVSLSYSLNGTFLGIDNLPLESLYHCWNSKLAHQKILFGQSLSKKCSWNIQELLQASNEPKFYEFYLRINHSSLVPVPIQIIPHRNSESKSWILRRFLFADSKLGIEEETLKLWFLIFAKRTVLQFDYDNKKAQLFVPKLVVEYRILESEELNRKSIRSHFELNFRSRDSDGRLNLRITLLIFAFLSILWSIFKTWQWRQRSGFIHCNCLATSGIFLVRLCQSCANSFMGILFLFLANQLFVFKYQKTVHSLLPSKEFETEILTYIFIVFTFKTIQIISRIYEITSIEIFFMDWEKPRKKLTDRSHASTMNGNGQAVVGNTSLDKKLHPGDDGSMYKRYKRTSTQLENLTATLDYFHTPVTIWRSYFVANEWYELAKKRRINLFFHICIVVLFLESSQLCKQMVKSTPANSDPTEVENLREISNSISCRMVFAAAVYAFIGFLQYFYQRFLKEACGASKLNEFMDLCTVSNISVFCLLQRRFGYYLHGLSPNGRSEVNMMEMYELLEMEESDLCSKRGLMANTEQQTFEMFLPREIHANLLTLRRPVDLCQPTFFERIFSFTDTSGEHFRMLSKEKLFQVYLSINRFLTSFIDHTYDRIDYKVVDKNRWERAFGLERNGDTAKLYNDNGSSMENILFFGLEVTFITFEMLSFIIVDLIVGGNFMLAGIGSATLSLLIKHFYIRGTRRNLIQKTLVDDRFLI